VAAQVPSAPAGKVRRNDKPVRVPTGVRHRHHGSRWKNRCDGNIFSCRLVWTCPDLAHELRPRVSLFLGRALRKVRCKLRQCLPAAWCGGSPPCGEARARGDSPDVHLPLHQGARYYTSQFRCFHHHGLLCSVREYVMKKCWRSWPRTTWKLSPHSSPWPANVPEPPRAVHGTRPHKPGLPSRVTQAPSPGTIRRKGRRIATTRSRGPPRWSLQPRPGAGATATNVHGRRGVTAAHALCTPTDATTPRSVVRSLTSRNASASSASSLPKTALHLVADLAKKRWTTVRWPRLNRTSGISHLRGT
jgi:hypothetical protein